MRTVTQRQYKLPRYIRDDIILWQTEWIVLLRGMRCELLCGTYAVNCYAAFTANCYAACAENGYAAFAMNFYAANFVFIV